MSSEALVLASAVAADLGLFACRVELLGIGDLGRVSAGIGL